MTHTIVLTFTTEGDLPDAEREDLLATSTLEDAADRVGWLAAAVWGLGQVDAACSVKVESEDD